jgi:hypothetical protein
MHKSSCPPSCPSRRRAPRLDVELPLDVEARSGPDPGPESCPESHTSGGSSSSMRRTACRYTMDRGWCMVYTDGVCRANKAVNTGARCIQAAHRKPVRAVYTRKPPVL